mgnify:CR=1 FL=1
MNLRIIVIFVLIFAPLTPACADRKPVHGPICGGWSPAAVSNEAVVAASVFAIKAKKELLQAKSGTEKPDLTLATILKAEQQVVAGVNYRLWLAVILDGRHRVAETIVWWQSWRDPDPYRLVSWDWDLAMSGL